MCDVQDIEGFVDRVKTNFDRALGLLQTSRREEQESIERMAQREEHAQIAQLESRLQQLRDENAILVGEAAEQELQMQENVRGRETLERENHKLTQMVEKLRKAESETLKYVARRSEGGGARWLMYPHCWRFNTPDHPHAPLHSHAHNQRDD